MTKTRTVDSALEYRRRLQWSVIPLAPNAKVPPKGFPLRQYFRTLPDEDELTTWYNQWQKAGVAVVTGQVSGVGVLDIDQTNHKENADANLAERVIEMCDEAPLVATPHGHHLYFRYGDGFPPLRQLPSGFQYKGDGGYAVLPPSQLRDGAYRWLREPSYNMMPMPNDLVNLLINHSGETVKQPDIEGDAFLQHTPLIYPVVSVSSGCSNENPLHEVARDYSTAAYIMGLAGSETVPLGTTFCCILPGHEEHHPSAAWYRAEDGRILYHDFHRTSEGSWFTLGEVYRSVVTGQNTPLSPVYSAQWLAHLALRMGYTSPLVARQQQKIALLSEYLPADVPVTVLRLFEALGNHFLIEAMSGFSDAKASTRFLAEKSGLALMVTNRSVNLLCALGILEKSPGNSLRGDRLRLATIPQEEIIGRWLLLEKPNLGQIDKKLVEAKLGSQLANRIFRRK